MRMRSRAVAACACGVLSAVLVSAQSLPSTSASNPFLGSITVRGVSDEPVRLSLDEAVRRGLRSNLGVRQAQDAEQALHGQQKQALQAFLPTITLESGSGFHQHNLAATGFRASALSKFAAVIPPSAAAGFEPITKNSLTYGHINFRQILFSGPVIAGYRAARAAGQAAEASTASARGQLIDTVANTYLRAVAAASEVDQASALERADRLAFEQMREAHQAGTVARLDELRAQLEMQAQQQRLFAAQSARDKALLLLKREIGIDPGQSIVLTDPVPFSEIAERKPAELLATALDNRQDVRSLRAQLEQVKAVHAAYRGRRLPTLAFGGYWGVDQVNGAGTRGNFAAVGRLSVPLFREAGQRGEEQATAAQLSAVNAQLADLRERVDQQLRAALLDVDAAARLVSVARSNVDLAQKTLDAENERVLAGIDENLPLVQAQASVAAAESDLVERLYQFNAAKLALARAAGVLELQYRDYLGL